MLSAAPPALVIRGFVRFPGFPAIPDYAPELDAFVEGSYRRQKGLFDGSGAGPRPRFLSVLTRR